MYFLLRKALVKIYFFALKHATVFSSVCLLSLILIYLHPSFKLSKVDPARLVITQSIDPSVYECCTPLNNSLRTNVYFIKNHKTGSTTVQSVLLRFALLNSLDVMNIKYGAYYKPLSDSSIHSDTITANNKYHILAQHTRYDPKLKSYQYPDTPMVTLLRHPAKLFQSLYNFFYMDKLMGMSFEEFLNAPVKPTRLRADGSMFAYRGYNQMSVDLGFDITQSWNETAVEEFIKKIDQEFDLVMITEHMEASLVLLANLMGWPLEYVAYLSLNARPPDSDPYQMTLQDEITLTELNHVDTLLYHHFVEKFRKCTERYGKDKLDQQVNRLKMINRQLRERCVAEEISRGLHFGYLKSIEYVLKNESDLTCVYSTQINPTLAKVARMVQAERLQQRLNPT